MGNKILPMLSFLNFAKKMLIDIVFYMDEEQRPKSLFFFFKGGGSFSRIKIIFT